MNKQQLASKIWESANKMRSKIEANEYKDYILGFIFYKYLSDQEVKFLKDNDFTNADIESLVEDDTDTVEYIQKNIGYFISYDNLFSTWLEMGAEFSVDNVRIALSAFSRLIYKTYKKVFDKIFETLDTGLSKLGENAKAQTKAISGLLSLIKDIPMDGKQDYDVLGFIYEYLISQFAANAGKKAGEFYTPHEVSLLMSEIVAEHLKGQNEIKIYDPTSGSGSLLINIGHSVSKYMKDKNNIKYYAQELKENTYNLTRMNLVMRGIKPDNIVTRNGDTLEEDWPYFDPSNPTATYEPLYVDAVVSNPPYSQQWDPKNKDHDARYSEYGLAPASKADYAFLLHDLYHVKPDGIMTIVLPHGVLFRGGEEGNIRKNLIENSKIDTIIGLPANIFFGTGIPTIIMVLKQKRVNNDVLIIDASKGFVKEGKNNKLRACDIKKIVDTVINRESINKFSKVVSIEEIRENDYNLNIPRYVDSSDKVEEYDIYASMFGGIPEHELVDFNEYWNAFPSLKDELFVSNGTPYLELRDNDIKSVVLNNKDVIDFNVKYNESFKDFNEFLNNLLISNIKEVQINSTEQIISDKIFECLKDIPLVNKYEAYQLLDESWKQISSDIEIIQSEGLESIRRVDPNMVVKKKDGKDSEVQDGWIGRIIPFELVQEELLSDDLKYIKEKENRLSEIPSLYEEIIESMTEDEKDTDVLNEENDAFVSKEVTKKLKELKLADKTDEVKVFITKLTKYEKYAKEEKDLKKEIKQEQDNLTIKTKELIESLSNSQIDLLLNKKWNNTLVSSMRQIPNQLINNFISSLNIISKKYSQTLLDIDTEITNVEKELCSMIDDLVGNEYDMKGLQEFKALLGGDLDEK